MALDFTGLIDQRQREIDRRGVEPVGYGNLSGDDLVEIDISQIKMNRLNRRTMRDDDIQIIAESILSKGLITPITVYRLAGSKTEDNPDGKDEFVIISGHRRFQAINLLNNSPEYNWHTDTVLCHIIDQPSSNSEELEFLAQANIHRYDNEDLKNEIVGCMDAWREMDRESQLKLRKNYEEKFHEKCKTIPAYISNADEYTRQNFRPIYDYVRSLTGLDCSNSTIKRMADSAIKAANLVQTSDDVTSVTEDNSTEDDELNQNPDELRVAAAEKLIKKIESTSKAIKKFLDDDGHAKVFNSKFSSQLIDGKSIYSYCHDNLLPELDNLIFQLDQTNALTKIAIDESEKSEK